MSAGSELVTFDEKQGLSPNEVLVHTHDWVFRSALPDVQYRALVHCQFADSSHGWLIIIIEHGGFYVVQIRQTQHDAAIVRFSFPVTHFWRPPVPWQMGLLERAGRP